LVICCGTGIELGTGDPALGVELGDTVGVAAVASLGFAVGPRVGKDFGETLGSSVFVKRDVEGD
jgi:hypothetical protein